MQRKLVGSLLLAIILFILVLSISFRSILHARDTETWVRQAHVSIENINGLSASLTEAESSQRGYLITGDKAYLDAMNAALEETRTSLEHMRDLMQDDVRLRINLEKLRPAVDERMQLIQQAVELQETKGPGTATELARKGRAKGLGDQIRSILAEMTREETDLLAAREGEAEINTQDTLRAMAVGSLFGILLLLVAGWLLQRQTDSLQKAQEGLRKTNETLTRSMSALTTKTAQARTLAEMSDILQSCLTLEEAREVIARFFRELLPGDSGAIYLHNHSRECMEPLLAWGESAPQTMIFGADDCWALRRGRPHKVNAAESVVLCKHIETRPESDCQCIPLVAQNEAFGLMYLESGAKAEATEVEASEAETEEHDLLVRRMAESVALACANLRLRETLRYQSIRDGLTGLFNRRYLDETLEREVRRAARHSRPVSVILLDLDHFKKFNDTLGHAAGDALLRALGDFLRGQVRQEDIACRYGGEEFALVLPDAAIEIAVGRAEQIREGVKHLAWQQQIPSAESVTVSAGVAVFPVHGGSAAAILLEADRALYAAKAGGRDRVMIAGAEEMSRAGSLVRD
ncbi:MAG TPA: diguanylate cyclase [Candidatus Acidoferrum sp.]|nr:diguanylate cyclase [Candidatus Acidoferrum sp.]